MNFMPNDDTAEVINELISMGLKVNENIQMDFFVAFEEENDAKDFMKDQGLNAFSLDLEFEEDLNCWTSYCTKELSLNYGEIKKTEDYLNDIAKKYNGYADGFSTDVN